MVKFNKQYNIKISQVLSKRTHLRHRINHETIRDKLCIRRALYEPERGSIVVRLHPDPTVEHHYRTPTAFCNYHYAQRRNDRVSNCNGWKEVEAFIEGEWVSLMDLRSKFIQSRTNMASNKA